MTVMLFGCVHQKGWFVIVRFNTAYLCVPPRKGLLAGRYTVLLTLFFKFLLLLLFQKKITKPQPQQSVRYKSPTGPVSSS